MQDESLSEAVRTLERAWSARDASTLPAAPLLRHYQSTPAAPPAAPVTIDFDAVLRAAQMGDARRVCAALEGGLPVNTEDYWSRTLLYAACLCGHFHLVRYLLCAGATDHPGERRCAKNALSKPIIRLLQPMYDAEELRMALNVEAHSGLATPRPGVVVRVHRPKAETAAEGEDREERNLEHALRSIAQTMNVTHADLAFLREALKARMGAAAHGDNADGDGDTEQICAPTAFVGSLPGGGVMPRGEYNNIEWGSWPVRYARWLLEKPDRVRQYQEQQSRRTALRSMESNRGAQAAANVKSTKRQLKAHAKLARGRSAPPRRASPPMRNRIRPAVQSRRTSRRRRSRFFASWDASSAPIVLVNNGLTAPRMFRGDPARGFGAAPALAKMHEHVLDEHFPAPSGRRTSAKKIRKNWKTVSEVRSVGRDQQKRPRMRDRARGRSEKVAERAAPWG